MELRDLFTDDELQQSPLALLRAQLEGSERFAAMLTARLEREREFASVVSAAIGHVESSVLAEERQEGADGDHLAGADIDSSEMTTLDQPPDGARVAEEQVGDLADGEGDAVPDFVEVHGDDLRRIAPLELELVITHAFRRAAQIFQCQGDVSSLVYRDVSYAVLAFLGAKRVSA